MLFAESRIKVALDESVIFPFKVIVPQPPTVFIEYEKEADGVPLIDTVLPEVVEVMPVGNPVKLTLVTLPPKVYWIGVIEFPEQMV